jgi:hypothetical protein
MSSILGTCYKMWVKECERCETFTPHLVVITDMALDDLNKVEEYCQRCHLKTEDSVDLGDRLTSFALLDEHLEWW